MAKSDEGLPGHQPDPRIEEWLARLLPRLRAFLGRRAPNFVLEQESAEDLAQSVCRDVLAHIDDGRFELRSEAEFRQWVFEAGLLKLKARRKFLRADKRDHGGALGSLSPLDSEDPGIEPSSSETPSRFAATLETRERVRAAIASLGGRDAEVLRLVVLEGRPHAEAAATLGLDPAHCRMVLSRAMAKLAAALQRSE
ncbi:MAG: sigma-70 family RNA polymerase sigma factor [Planctomycetota bacterium]